MPDFCDRAAEQTALHLAAVLSARQMAAGRGPVWRIAGKEVFGNDISRIARPFCRVCGEEIPAARVRALPGVETCVECAREAE